MPQAAARMLLAGVVMMIIAGAGGCDGAGEPSDLAQIKLPPGFAIAVYAKVPSARSMALALPLGGMFVGTRRDTVYGVFDRDQDGHVAPGNFGYTGRVFASKHGRD